MIAMNERLKTTWFNYVPIADAGPSYEDDGSRVILSIPLKREGQDDLELALIGDIQTIDLIRVATPHSDGRLSIAEQEQNGRGLASYI
jgi:hypothetical protein